MTKHELVVYTAGIIDGEGTIGCYDDFTLKLMVTSTCECEARHAVDFC